MQNGGEWCTGWGHANSKYNVLYKLHIQIAGNGKYVLCRIREFAIIMIMWYAIGLAPECGHDDQNSICHFRIVERYFLPHTAVLRGASSICDSIHKRIRNIWWDKLRHLTQTTGGKKKYSEKSIMQYNSGDLPVIKKKYMRRKGKKWVRVPFEIINFVTLSHITLTVCCAVCILGFRLAWGHKSHHTKLYVCRRRAIIAHMVEIGGDLRLCTTAIHAALRHKHTTLWRHNTGCRAYQGSIT